MAHQPAELSVEPTELPNGAEVYPVTEDVVARMNEPEPPADDRDHTRFMAIGILSLDELSGGMLIPTSDVLYASPRGRFVVNTEIFGKPTDWHIYQHDDPWQTVDRSWFVPQNPEPEEGHPHPTPDHLIDFACERLDAYTKVYDAYGGPATPDEILAERRAATVQRGNQSDARA